VSRPWIVTTPIVMLLTGLVSGVAAAQSTPAQPGAGNGASRLWFVAGGASTSVLGDCTNCEEEPRNYRHAGGVLINAGVAINRRLDAGAEVLWVPSTTVNDEPIRTTFVMAAVQFRPWLTRGLFLKAGSGLAFVRNWVVDFEGGDLSPPFTSKAFALGLGAGWEWRLRGRVGVQAFGAQHVATLGDLQTGGRTAENVVGNYWSAGAAFVVR
jgi:hypothetical protein